MWSARCRNYPAEGQEKGPIIDTRPATRRLMGAGSTLTCVAASHTRSPQASPLHEFEKIQSSDRADLRIIAGRPVGHLCAYTLAAAETFASARFGSGVFSSG